jgi:hypothetical protein
MRPWNQGPAGGGTTQTSDDFLLQPPAVSLPQGGGAIGGMGEKFQVNAATGTSGLSLPLPLSPARLTPSVGLSYDSGAPNGPFGLGWQLSVPSIVRKTSRGLPTYHDARSQAPEDEEDTFVLSGSEDLVPRLRSDGSWAVRSVTEGSNTYRVYAYRPRTEGGFARIERWTDTGSGDTHWRTQSSANSWQVYGLSASARVANPNDSSRVFEWKLEREWDERGNYVSYTWVQEDRAGVSRSIYEQARSRPGHTPTWTYLKRVDYGNTHMDPFGTGSGSNAWLFSVVFDYGEHNTSDPEFSASGSWSVRQDPYSTYRAGFEQRCYRLCRRVLLFHNVDELKAQSSDPPVLVRSLELTYEEDPRVTLLTDALTRGWMDDGQGGWDTKTTPGLSLDYSRPTLGSALESIEGLDDLPVSFEAGRFQFVDLDGEGLSGLLCEQGGVWFYKCNEGGGRFGRFARLGSRPNLDLGRPDVRLVDLQGDGQLDLVQQGRGFSARNDEGGWNPLKPFHEVPNLNWNDPNLRLLDLDGDGHADLLLTDSRALWWYPGKAEEGFGEARKVWRPDNEDEGPVLLFGSESESIFLADMSGDGLTDIVQVRNGSVCYWPNLGYGRFGARVQLASAPRFDTRERFDPRRVRLVDLDGSGPTDLMYLGPDKVRVWFNQSGNSWSDEVVLSRIPGVSNADTVQVSDLLGDGTTCVVWSTRSPRASTRGLRYLRVMADGKPWLLTSIVNNRGRTTSLEYTPSTSFYTQARQAGTPWATRLPFPVQCLSKVETIDGVTGWRFTQQYAYHHGCFDGHEREFRGFGRVDTWDTEVVPDPADFNNDSQLEYYQPPVYTRTWFHTGAWKKALDLEAAYAGEYWSGDSSAQWLDRDVLPAGLSPEALREAHRALRGQTLRTEVYALDGSASEGLPYTVSMSRVAVRQLQETFGEDRPGVWLTVPLETLSRHYERVATDPRTTHELTLYAESFCTIHEPPVSAGGSVVLGSTVRGTSCRRDGGAWVGGSWTSTRSDRQPRCSLRGSAVRVEEVQDQGPGRAELVGVTCIRPAVEHLGPAPV